MSRHDFFPHCIALPSQPLLQGADGEQCKSWRLASDVAFNIMNTPVVGSLVMDELRLQGKERCFEGAATHLRVA
jgi:hypothetical protein